MDEKVKRLILKKAKDWWRKEIATSHKKNTEKLVNIDRFIINPFIWSYLSYFFEGNSSAESLARVLIYPRILGTSIVTSFGQRSQQMITKLFEGISGSTTKGIDIEFVDKIDGRKKYCQVKAGPNVINKDDVPTIKNHFRDAMNLARTNNLQLQNSDFMFCLLYGEDSQKNTFVKEIEKDYPVVIGEDFWRRFTGDKNFYRELIEAIRSVAKESDSKLLIETVVKKLAKQVTAKYPKLV